MPMKWIVKLLKKVVNRVSMGNLTCLKIPILSLNDTDLSKELQYTVLYGNTETSKTYSLGSDGRGCIMRYHPRELNLAPRE